MTSSVLTASITYKVPFPKSVPPAYLFLLIPRLTSSHWTSPLGHHEHISITTSPIKLMIFANRVPPLVCLILGNDATAYLVMQVSAPGVLLYWSIFSKLYIQSVTCPGHLFLPPILNSLPSAALLGGKIIFHLD